MAIMTGAKSDDFLNVAVPKRHYALVIRTIAQALAAEGSTRDPAPCPAERNWAANPSELWSADRIRHLRQLLTNPTARAMMDLTCSTPGRRVSLEDLEKRTGRSFHQSRADLAVLTKLIRRRFGHDVWPVNVAQGGNGTLTYDASPDIAAAWTARK